ncbi:MAG TPA: S8 family serine peptidase, partial [Solirubrobacterales bacterium]
IFGHAGAASAIAVAAVPFDDSTEPEPYSSRGPVTHYFGPVAGVTPAPPLGSPEVVAKPDLAATDCGATTFFASLSAGVWRFCGTSAAAPHAAAVAALVRQAKPSLSEQQVREALADTAAPVGAFGPEAVGAGLVDAFEAIGSLPPPIEGGDGPDGSAPPEEPPGETPTGGTTSVVPLPVAPTPPAPAPNTLIVRRPPKLVRTPLARARVVFRFGSDQAGVTFLCKIDRAPFGRCNARIVRRLAPGRHLLKVKARNAGGLVDATPAVFRFRIEAT